MNEQLVSGDGLSVMQRWSSSTAHWEKSAGPAAGERAKDDRQLSNQERSQDSPRVRQCKVHLQGLFIKELLIGPGNYT